MPDAITPVGLSAKGPDLGTLSSILGIQQQRQSLQTGAYQQQAVQAESEQAQQKNAELQAVGNLVKTATTSARYLKPDGSFDDGKFSSDVAQVAPVYGQSVRTQALSAANEILANKQGLQALNEKQQAQLGGMLTSLAQKPDLSNTDVIDAIEAARQLNPDPAYGRMLTSVATHLAPDMGSDALRQKIQQIQSQVSGQPQNVPTTLTGAQGILGATQNRNTGALNVAGGPVPGTAPAAIAGSTAAATATAGGNAADDSKRAEQISQSVAPSRQAITLADQVANLSDQVHTGKFSKLVTDYAATIGQNSPEIAARQLISKYAAQLQTVATQNAPTDSARATIAAGFPDPEHMSPEAIRGASEFIKGNMLMNLSRAANARKFMQMHGGTQGLRIADDNLTTNADPLMYTYQNIPAGASRQEFLKRHFQDPQNIQDFIRRKNAVASYGGFDQ